MVTLNFAAVYVLWGSTYLAIRCGVQDLPPALMAGTRFAIAGLILFGWLRLRGVPLPPRGLLGPIALTGILMLFCANWLVTWSEITVSSGMAAVIVANLPFFMVGLEAMRRDGERIAPLGWAGMIIGSGGMLLLMWPKLAGLGSGGLWGMRGEIALLGADFFWAFGSIYSKHRIRGVDALMSVALQMLVAGAALLAAGTLLGEWPRYHLTARAAGAVAWLVVAGSLLGYSAYMWLLSNVPAAKVATYAYVNPVIALMLGWLILDEPLGWRMAAGTGIILSGVAAVNLARVRIRS
jgi:drug/metabolite transporter (DMT)-like permease